MSKVPSLSLLALLAQSSIAALIPRASPDFGSCSNPTIEYVKDADGIPGWGYKPADTKNFAHGASADIIAITDFICSNLQNVCRAPTTSYELCLAATAKSKEQKEKAAAEAFNNAITATTPAATSTSPTTIPTATVQPKVNIKFSKEQVTFPGHIDPKWWFDTYFIAEGNPAICESGSHRMPEDNYLSFDCEFADNVTAPIIKAALNAVVDATLDNTDIKEEERMFQHIEESYTDEQGDVVSWPSTIFPQSVHIAVAVDIPGVGSALSGNMRYSISKFSSNACKMCSFLSGGGTTTAATAKVVEVV
ncbi:hypothetical protein K458DRAFT_283926, partial [Lentithecium fluviatile CBS 122367]